MRSFPQLQCMLLKSNGRPQARRLNARNCSLPCLLLPLLPGLPSPQVSHPQSVIPNQSFPISHSQLTINLPGCCLHPLFTSEASYIIRPLQIPEHLSASLHGSLMVYIPCHVHHKMPMYGSLVVCDVQPGLYSSRSTCSV